MTWGSSATHIPMTWGRPGNVAASRFTFRCVLHGGSGFDFDLGINFAFGSQAVFSGSWMFCAIGFTSL